MNRTSRLLTNRAILREFRPRVGVFPGVYGLKSIGRRTYSSAAVEKNELGKSEYLTSLHRKTRQRLGGAGKVTEAPRADDCSTEREPWTQDEEVILYRRGLVFDDLEMVAEGLDGRTKEECTAKWKEMNAVLEGPIVPAVEQATEGQRFGRFWPHEDAKIQEEVERIQQGDASRKPTAAQWKEIAKQLGRRSADGVKTRWSRILHPQWDHSPLSAEDREVLKTAIEEYDQQWSVIQKVHFPRRTCAQLRAFWRSGCRLKPQAQRTNYGAAVFAKVDALLEKNTYTNPQGVVRWTAMVAAEMPEFLDRAESFRQCYVRSRSYRATARSGQWSKDETERLVCGVAALTPDFTGNKGAMLSGFWVEIARRVGPRTPGQCAARYTYITTLHHDVLRWEYSELLKLLQLCELHRFRWSRICKLLPRPRSPQACRERFLVSLRGSDWILRGIAEDLVDKFDKHKWAGVLQATSVRKGVIKVTKRKEEAEEVCRIAAESSGSA
ncbi:Transcription factor RAX1 [Neolecta irregularis DAH-3]|uniref:Transcription factor RAX1 n=1 Tax=Neolecta irregularis (strain DAH-3) TaxID=1198029 RepID=A0A1U7LVP7_NEOID|nr:Transcription factor RAX1 [Neolecta irregularis DAH-3]|eukprot:OLL26698.1 Transcription factor RAX1 [Neolecta irregularis DAH-3]